MKLYFKELDFKELGVLGYLLGVLGYSDLLGLGVPDELLLNLLVERPWLNGLGPHGAGDHMGPISGQLWTTKERFWGSSISKKS